MLLAGELVLGRILTAFLDARRRDLNVAQEEEGQRRDRVVDTEDAVVVRIGGVVTLVLTLSEEDHLERVHRVGEVDRTAGIRVTAQEGATDGLLFADRDFHRSRGGVALGVGRLENDLVTTRRQARDVDPGPFADGLAITRSPDHLIAVELAIFEVADAGLEYEDVVLRKILAVVYKSFGR